MAMRGRSRTAPGILPVMSNRELTSPTGQTDLQALDQFVVDNDELLQLEERIGRFNIFDALRIVDAEIRHSNFLAWLLDPAESHGQGPLFLKAILMDLLRQSPPELRPLSPVEIDGAELRGVEVRREWRNIDILITCKDPAFVIAVENKVRAGKHNPFSEYDRRVRSEYPDTSAMFVLLTVDGSELEEFDWVPYTYEDIHNVLTRVRKTHATSIGDDVLAFLDHYTRLIGSRFMDDPKIDELCQTIYKNHRQALDLIFERVGSTQAGLLSAITQQIEEDPTWHIVYRGPRYVEFIPKDWDSMLPALGKRKVVGKDQWLTLQFRVGKKQCFNAVRVAPISDSELRQSIIERLIQDPKEFGLKSLFKKADLIGGNWTTLGRVNVARWDPDEEPDETAILAKTVQILNKRAIELQGVSEALKPIVKSWSIRRNQA